MNEFNEFARRISEASKKLQPSIDYRRHLLVHAEGMHYLITHTPVRTGALQASWKPTIESEDTVRLDNRMHYASFIDKGFTMSNGRWYRGKELVRGYTSQLNDGMDKAIRTGMDDACKEVFNGY